MRPAEQAIVVGRDIVTVKTGLTVIRPVFRNATACKLIINSIGYIVTAATNVTKIIVNLEFLLCLTGMINYQK